jgi:hypothetical protein
VALTQVNATAFVFAALAAIPDKASRAGSAAFRVHSGDRIPV